MNSMAIVRKNVEYRNLVRSCQSIMDRCHEPDYSIRVGHKIAKFLIMNSPVKHEDERYEAVAKSLGCGVYLITFKKEPK